MGRKKRKTATGSRLNVTKEYHCPNQDGKEEAVTRGEEEETPNFNCGESTKSLITSFHNQKNLEDYNSEGPGADTQPSWRPPMPIEDGIWKPIRVKTNGEGRERLLCAEPLLEVYDVKVLDMCGKTYGNIHGNIMLDCVCYRTYLFNCDKQSALMIHKKGSLPLIGPDIAPIAYDPIMIMFNLNIDDDKLCEDIVEWKPLYNRTNEWLYDEIKGSNGSVEVTYVVMKDAWLAELDVKLIKSTTETTSSRIHGDIIVYINDMQYLRYFVFSKRTGDSSTIKSLEPFPFPLSRSLFCCRSGSSLVVKVDLWNSDTNEPFVRGALLFPPEYYGDSVGKLSSRYGEIQVTVNWVYYMEHSKTCDALRGCHPWVDLIRM